MKEFHCLNCYQKNELIMSVPFGNKKKKMAYAACPDCGFVMKASVGARNAILKLEAAENTKEVILHAYQAFSKKRAPSKAEIREDDSIDLQELSQMPEIDLPGMTYLEEVACTQEEESTEEMVYENPEEEVRTSFLKKLYVRFVSLLFPRKEDAA